MTCGRASISTVLAGLLAVAVCAPAAAQVGGSLIAFPPEELYLDITEDAAGHPHLSTEEIHLVTGEYYRLNVSSTGDTDWRFEAPDLLQNIHLRVVTINGIEVHLQALMFRAIEFDEPGAASFSFTPIRPGRFAYTVGRNPIAQGLERGQAGVQEADRRAEGLIVVD